MCFILLSHAIRCRFEIPSSLAIREEDVFRIIIHNNKKLRIPTQQQRKVAALLCTVPAFEIFLSFPFGGTPGMRGTGGDGKEWTTHS